MSLLVRAAGFLLGMLVTALAAIVLFISVSFDERQMNADIRDFVESEYERSWSTDSDIHLSLLPWPSLQIGPANLSEPNRQEAFASWKKASFELDALALLRHKVVIRHARIDGLTLRLARDQKGVWNAADLLNDDPDFESPISMQLEGLALSHASVVMEDAASGRSLQWRGLELGTDAWLANRGGRMQIVAQLVSPNSTLEGKLSVSARYHFGESLDNGMLSAAQIHYVGSIDTLNAADITLGLGTATWQADQWQLADMHVRASGMQGAQSLELTAALPAARWHGALQAGNASAQLTLRNTAEQGGSDMQGQLNLALQDIVPAGANTSIAWLEGSWQLQAGKQGTQGKLRGQLQHDAKARQLNLDKITGDFSLMHPALNATNARASLQGKARWALSPSPGAPRGEFNVDAAFGKDVLHVVTSIAADRMDKPVITARIDSEHFDVDRLLSAGVPAVSLPASDWLHGKTVDAVLRATNVKFGGMQMTSVYVPVKIADDRLALAGHELDLYGGKLAGSASYDATKQELTLFETLREVQLDTLARDAKLDLPITGLTNATLDVRSQGAQVHAMPDKAKGVLRIYAKNARWQGVDLPRRMLALHGGKAVPGSGQQATPLTELSAAFRVEGPTLLVDRLAAHADGFGLTATGNMQYASRNMDLLLGVRIGNDKALAELRGKRMSLRVKGPLTGPQVSIEP
ncbi:MAG: hypothetical protein JWL63_2192 [Rhodocyclales bacterium]|nr:hypothetical protein [Rhodocyclales bacterium]